MKAQKAKMKGNEGPKGKFWKRKMQNLKKKKNFGPAPGEMVLLEGSKGQNERKRKPPKGLK